MMNFDRGGGKWQVVNVLLQGSMESSMKVHGLSKAQFFPLRDISTKNALSKDS